MPRKEPGYSHSLSRLEKIVADIESGAVDIDSLAASIKEAAALVKACREQLRSARKEVDLAIAEVDPEPDLTGSAIARDRGRAAASEPGELDEI